MPYASPFVHTRANILFSNVVSNYLISSYIILYNIDPLFLPRPLTLTLHPPKLILLLIPPPPPPPRPPQKFRIGKQMPSFYFVYENAIIAINTILANSDLKQSEESLGALLARTRPLFLIGQSLIVGWMGTRLEWRDFWE